MSRFGIKEGQEAKKPMPYVAPFAEGFWEGTKLGELRVQLCTKCGHKQWIPRPACEECGNRHLSWVKSNGRGHIYSFAIIRQVVMNSPAFEKEIPYALSIIELEDGFSKEDGSRNDGLPYMRMVFKFESTATGSRD